MSTSPASSRDSLKRAKTIIVKIGSAVLAPGGSLSSDAIQRIASDIAAQAAAGRRIVVVSSGAIASGFRALGLSAMPKTIVQKQAAAAVGQQRLMAAWSAAFEKHSLTVAQVLLTSDDMDVRDRVVNARRTFDELLSRGIVPIVNENDTVSYDEIRLGDNDRLSALVAGLIQADLLLILSGVEGLYAGGAAGRVLPFVASIEDARTHVRADKSAVGTGGMATKVAAAEIAADAGVPMVIAGGRVDHVVSRVLGGDTLGTLFAAGEQKLSARQRWLGHGTRPRGTVVVDDGARDAIIRKGASLLPSGIVSVADAFPAGSTVEIRAMIGEAFARGVAAYSSAEIQAIKGHRSSQIAGLLGYCYSDAVVHRNDMVLTGAGHPPAPTGKARRGAQ